MIRDSYDVEAKTLAPLPQSPQSVAPVSKIRNIALALKAAKAPLVVIGKGAAFGNAELQIRDLING